MTGVLVISFIVAAVISYYWTKGIDYMHRNHPDYKGEDFFNEEDSSKTDQPKDQ